jgi:hypothetical protein
MSKIICLPFEYRNKEYYSLVRVKDIHGCKELHVTIMNGELEVELYGNHIFRFRDGELQSHDPTGGKDCGHLIVQVGQAIRNYVSEHPLYEN